MSSWQIWFKSVKIEAIFIIFFLTPILRTLNKIFKLKEKWKISFEIQLIELIINLYQQIQMLINFRYTFLYSKISKSKNPKSQNSNIIIFLTFLSSFSNKPQNLSI